jgi:Domain of unknown function (DUF4389)
VLIISWFVHWLLVIPAAIVASVIGLLAYVVVLIAWFAILITGQFPQGMFDVMVIMFLKGTTEDGQDRSR